MKKSEMLNVMLRSYTKPVPYHDDGGIQLQWKLIRLLEDMVKAGMLPPDVGVGEEDDYGYIEYINEWEPEDE